MLEEEEPKREEAPNLDKEAYTTARFKPFLTPLNTPPAALLAGAIQSPATRAPAAHPRVPSADQRVVDEKEHHVWQAAFNTGRLGNTILQVNGQAYDRAKIQRLLQSPKQWLHHRDIPPPPTRHHELADHLLGHLFEQAKLDHL